MRYAFALFFCMITSLSRGQNLELNQLKSFIDKPAVSVTDSLTKAGWSLRPELSGAKDYQMYQTYSFGNHESEQAKAQAWFRIQADNGIINQLYYQSPGKEHFNLLLEEIKKTGTEKKDVQSIEENQISTYYVAKDYTFQTIVGTDSYTVMVMATK